MQAERVFDNPTPEELRAFAEEMPNCRITEFGNVNVHTRVTSRSAGSTYIVSDDPTVTSGQTITREEYDRLARMQDEHIAGRDMVVVDGYIGNVEDFRTSARLTIEKANANIAGMQQKLYYPRDGQDPEVHVIYTPNLAAPGYPDDRVIAVDLDNGVTRVLNSDYFGESKKGGLRMWNTIVYDRGGLALHAGCKVVPVGDREKVFLIIGLSGTGKTTTTFTTQNDSLPVQDDFVALMPGGKVYGTENGCFAKTFSLDPEFEPNIYGAVTKPDAYLENVFQDDRGAVNFFETSYTKNGRAVFGMDALGRWKDPREVGTVDYLLILNRNENLIPAVARLSQAQAAGFFMLGETTGTSAGGAAEEGKFLRVPGTNPFFPLRHGQQGNRILELLDSHPIEVFLLNTGRVGGREGDERSKKLQIPHSSAVVKAIAEETISWTEDEDFGYQVAESVPGIEDRELLQPRRLYERQGREDQYRAVVERLKTERVEFLKGFPELAEEIIKSVG
ncbi:MAG TPA: phosphoenolpyruvate carboxykinase [Actinomycetota bacterium]|nr:phosphoenolpyruvate carboxykinase [Actinomycetota bacterium]